MPRRLPRSTVSVSVPAGPVTVGFGPWQPGIQFGLEKRKGRRNEETQQGASEESGRS